MYAENGEIVVPDDGEYVASTPGGAEVYFTVDNARQEGTFSSELRAPSGAWGVIPGADRQLFRRLLVLERGQTVRTVPAGQPLWVEPSS